MLELEPVSGSIALIGDLSACANYAERYHQQHPNTSYGPVLEQYLQVTDEDEGVMLYHAGEFYNSQLTGSLRVDTEIVLIVDDLMPRAHEIYNHVTTLGFRSQILLASDSLGLSIQQKKLLSSDWVVLRELERMFLSELPLHKQREQLRTEVKLDTEVVEFIADEVVDCSSHLGAGYNNTEVVFISPNK